jgi:hypothetical protein
MHDGTEYVFTNKRRRGAEDEEDEPSRVCPKRAALQVLEATLGPEKFKSLLKEMGETTEELPERKRNSKRRMRVRWTPAEDAIIMHARMAVPPELWEGIAGRLDERTPRECRDRWHHYLSPEIRSEPWTHEEDALLVEKINEMGPAWKFMVPLFHKRTEDEIKGRWISHVQFETLHDGTEFVFRERQARRDLPERGDTGDCPKGFKFDGSESTPDAIDSPEGATGAPGRLFTPAEDAVIMRRRLMRPPETWAEIAARLKGRTAEQCRHRWRRHLSDMVHAEPWNSDEDALRVEKSNGIGPVRAKKVPAFSNRSDCQLGKGLAHSGKAGKSPAFLGIDSEPDSPYAERKEYDHRQHCAKKVALANLAKRSGAGATGAVGMKATMKSIPGPGTNTGNTHGVPTKNHRFRITLRHPVSLEESDLE